MLHENTTNETKVVLSAAAKCDAGKKNNEDSAYIKMNEVDNTFVAVIADGVGGLDRGELAARYVTKSIENWFRDIAPELRNLRFEELKDEMLETSKRIHQELKLLSAERGCTIGTTMTFAVIGRKKYCIVQVGDSRAYLFNGSWVSLITRDQTVAEYEKETGKIFAQVAEQRKPHTLMQCMGIRDIDPKCYFGELPPNFDILMCSDGLSNTLSEVDIKNALKTDTSCSTVLNMLINKARDRGETDNITGIMIRRRKGFPE